MFVLKKKEHLQKRYL